MHLEHAPHNPSAPVNLSCAGLVLVRERWAGNQLGLGHQALGSPLGLQQPRLSVVSGKDRGSQMRDLDRQTCRLFVNFAADLKQAERIEALAVFDEVLADSGQKGKPHQRLVGGDRIGHGHVVGRVKAESASVPFADKGIVVDFRKSLRGDPGANRAQEFALRKFGRYAHCE